ncbi:MAG: T9SS type B sorting domain-containing protein, partial [Bacteroidia bacterium]
GNLACTNTNVACTGTQQGVWGSYSTTLPAACNNVPSLFIGFRWTNNGDNVGTDPSFAVDDITLKVAATYTPQFTLTGPVCSGAVKNVTCTVNPATVTPSSYTWSASPAGPTFGAPNASVTSITFPTAGTFSITVTTSVAASGTASATQTIQVIATPTLSAVAAPATVCVGSQSTLTATGASTYTWNPTAIISPSTGSVVTATPVTPGVTVFTVVGTSAVGGCTAQATTTLTATPPLTVTVAASTPTVCSGGSATLTAGGATSYTWLPSNSTGSTTVVSPTVATTYTVVGQTGSCLGATVITIGMGTALNVTLTASSPTVCPGGTVSISASGATNYTWSPGSSLSSTSGATVIASPTVNTTYNVQGASGTCTGNSSISITIGPPLGVAISASPSPTICPGGTTTLTATGATSFTWSPSLGLSSTTNSVVVASPTVSTLYTVIGTNTTGCTGTSSINVTIGPPLTITVSPTTGTTCVGGTPVNLTVIGATNYVWSPSTGLSNSFGPIVVATPSTTTTYTVLGSTGTCTGQAVATVSVIAPPTLTVTPTSTLICNGGAMTFTAAMTPSANATYSWTPAYTLSSNTGATVSASPTVTTTYTVTGQSQFGCLALPKVITLTVVPVPTETLSLMTNTLGIITNTICSPLTTATLSVNTPTPPNGLSYSYSFAASPATGTILTSPTSQPMIYQPALPTIQSLVTFSVYTYYNGMGNLPGCMSLADTVSLRVFNCNPPVASFTTVVKNDTVCTKSCITFENTTTGGNPQTIHWYFPGGKPDTSTSKFPVICYNVPGTYTVSMGVKNPYGYDSVIYKKYIVVVDTPNTKGLRDTCIRFGQSVQLQGTQATYYTWSSPTSPNYLSCTHCAYTTATPTANIKYVLTGYNSKKCKYNDTVDVCVIFDCGEMFVPNAFSPNGDGVNDVLYVRGKCLSNFTFQIFSRWGEKVFETNSQEVGWDGRFNGDMMNTGVFVYRLEGTTVDNQPFNMKGNVTLIR